MLLAVGAPCLSTGDRSVYWHSRIRMVRALQIFEASNEFTALFEAKVSPIGRGTDFLSALLVRFWTLIGPQLK